MSTFKRSAGNYLLDKRFQLKFTAMFLGVGMLIYVGIGALYLELMMENTTLALVGSTAEIQDVEDSELAAALASADAVTAEGVARSDQTSVITLVAVLFVLIGTLLTMGIFITHKIAGPAYALRLMLNHIQDGNWHRIRALRDGDELQELGGAIQGLADYLQQQTRTWLEQLDKACQALDQNQAPDGLQILNELRADLAAKAGDTQNDS